MFVAVKPLALSSEVTTRVLEEGGPSGGRESPPAEKRCREEGKTAFDVVAGGVEWIRARNLVSFGR